MERDNAIFDLIASERKRQTEGIELIASENFVSPQVLEAMGSVLTNKYAEGYPGARYYGGCEVVDQVEQLAIDRLKELFNAAYANVQPHSGAQANMAVFLTVMKPGDTFLGLDLSHGGHLSHGSPVNSSGILYRPVAYGVKEDTGRVDYDMMEEVALREKPKLIVGGASAYSREWDYARMRSIADRIGAMLMIDMAHPAGLIAAGLLDNPVKYAHIVTSTTHKTLRGPRGGIILMGNDFPNPWGVTTPKGEVKMMSAMLNSAVFPGIQGGPLEHVIASKAVSFGEALTPGFNTYQQKVKKNAAVMADAFMALGYKVISGGTDNHSMLIDLRTRFPEISGKKVENTLVRAHITVNKNMVPFDSRSPFLTSGIRVGTPAVTTRGLVESDMYDIVSFIDEVLVNIENETVITSVGNKVINRMKDYPLFAMQEICDTYCIFEIMEKVSPHNEEMIYVVDDDPVVTGLVAARLESSGYRVKTFAYGEDCITALHDDIPDLIILDFYFIREGVVTMNGMEAYDEIARLAPDVPVIMLSAQEKGEVVLEFARKGIADYVIKDSDLIDNLQMAVKDVLER